MSIHSHRVCSFSRPKYLDNSILNICSIIIIEDGFKVTFFHIDTALSSLSTFGLLLISK